MKNTNAELKKVYSHLVGTEIVLKEGELMNCTADGDFAIYVNKGKAYLVPQTGCFNDGEKISFKGKKVYMSFQSL